MFWKFTSLMVDSFLDLRNQNTLHMIETKWLNKICFWTKIFTPQSGADPEILKRGGALCQPPWLVEKENFRFQMV